MALATSCTLWLMMTCLIGCFPTWLAVLIPAGPKPQIDPATTAANERYLQPFLPGLAEYRNSEVGRLLVDIAELVDVVPSWLEDLLVPMLLPGSALTIPLNATLQLKLPFGERTIPLPANFTLASITLDDLNEIKSLRPAELLPGGNFTWAGIAALRQTAVTLEVRLTVLQHPVNVRASVLLTVSSSWKRFVQQ
eukprot:SAG31_NODE_8984_length_1353_cov_1.165869_2_plen_194_part_00